MQCTHNTIIIKKPRPGAAMGRAQRSMPLYRFHEKVSELAGVKLGKKFSASQSFVQKLSSICRIPLLFLSAGRKTGDVRLELM